MRLGFDNSDISRNACMLRGKLREQGYDWWWHSFTARHKVTGKEKPFFIEFFVCNPALADDRPVLGQIPANKEAGKKPSYLMVKAGFWGKNAKQLHRFFSWNDVAIRMDAPFSVSADDCYLSEEWLRGSVSLTEAEVALHPEYMCDAGEMSWNLSVCKEVPFNVGYGAGRLMRTLNAFEMYWHAEGMKTSYTGEIVVDGETYEVYPEYSYGYADKNWGENFTTPWIWLSSNNLFSNRSGKMLKHSVFDIGGGKPKVFGISLNRILLGAFLYEGKPIEFNFSKFWTGARTKFKCRETDELIIWHVEQENWHYVMRTNIHCRKDEMLLVSYEAPDGTKRHNRLWNGGTGYGYIRLYEKTRQGRILIDEIDVSHVGCEYGEMDE